MPGKRRPVGGCGCGVLDRTAVSVAVLMSPKTCPLSAPTTVGAVASDLAGGSWPWPICGAVPGRRLGVGRVGDLRAGRGLAKESSDEFRCSDEQFRCSDEHGVGLPATGPRPAAEETDRGALGRPVGRVRVARRRPRAAIAALAGDARPRVGRVAEQRLQPLRPRAGLGPDARRRARAVPGSRSWQWPAGWRGGAVLRDGSGHRRRRAAGDDQVVRHELPLPGARTRAGHRVRPRREQAPRASSPRPSRPDSSPGR